MISNAQPCAVVVEHLRHLWGQPTYQQYGRLPLQPFSWFRGDRPEREERGEGKEEELYTYCLFH